MEITLNKPEVETLKVNIGDKSYSIPLGSSLTLAEYASLDTFEGTVKFYKKYIPEIDSLTFAEINQITKAWTEATQKANNLGLGEQ